MNARLFVLVAALASNVSVAGDLVGDADIVRIKGSAESAATTPGVAGRYAKFNLTLWLAPEGRYVTEEVNGCSQGIFVSTEKGVWRRDGARLRLVAQDKDAGGWAQPWEVPDVPIAEWLVVDGDVSPHLYAPRAVDEMVVQWNAYGRFPSDLAAVKQGEADDAAADPVLRELLADRLFDEPVLARITHVSGRNSTALDDSSVAFEITIDRGRADGLADDTHFFLLDEEAYAYVDEVDERTTTLRLYVHPIDANDADAVPDVGDALTTRSPAAGAAQARAFRLTELQALPAHPGALADHRYWRGRVATNGAVPDVGQRLWQQRGFTTAKVLDAGAGDALVLVRTCADCDTPKVGSRLFDRPRGWR